MSIFDLLKEYIETERIRIDKSRHPQLTTVHDPCNYVRKSQMAFGDHCGEMARWITAQCCENMVEMVDNPVDNLCCGAGGGAWAGPYAKERIDFGRWKADQIKATGAELVIAGCHNCRDQIKKSLTKEFDLGVETKYVWELVSDSLVIKPWSKKEIKEAHEKRDAQFKRDGVDIEALAS